ncbi:hypothetical protein [Chryseobacterium sp. GP-SGM7]|uniref:hypothetical protein n=1 Tax=Chryseobacterium sp. GP-SGM7 TaxID=3411323 RepID=UPI003B951B4C
MTPKNIILIVLLLFFGSSCTSKDLQSEVESKYKTCSVNSKIDSCKIDFSKDLTNLKLEDWDRMYIIPTGLDIPLEIAELHGWDNIILSESFLQKIIFVKNQKIIYQEGIGPRLSEDDRCLVFEEKKIICLNHHTAKFFIFTDNSLQYYLKRVNN